MLAATGSIRLISLMAICTVLASAHVEMKEPPPRHSQFSKFYMDNDDVDYNMKSPLGPIVGYPCRNFKAGPDQGTMIAGHPFRVQFDGAATHLGGDCQFAVSYDNGTRFAVIWDKLNTCLIDTVNGGYDVPVPYNIPASKKAIFAWTWINGLGSREYYMNCADVRIENYGYQEPLTAHELLVVNLPGRLTLLPKTGREEDKLPGMLSKRSLITVGKPVDLTIDEFKDKRRVQKEEDDDDDAEEDPMASKKDGTKSETQDESDLPDEITSFILTTRTITANDDDDDSVIAKEPNLDDGFSYAEEDRSHMHSKANNGLTILSEDSDISVYIGGGGVGYRNQPRTDTNIPFDVDETLPLVTHHLPTDDSLDIWPTKSGPEPLNLGTMDSMLPDSGSFMSMEQYQQQSVHQFATQFKAVTVSGKPMLQVVVSSNNTAIPSSLTIAYSEQKNQPI